LLEKPAEVVVCVRIWNHDVPTTHPNGSQHELSLWTYGQIFPAGGSETCGSRGHVRARCRCVWDEEAARLGVCWRLLTEGGSMGSRCACLVLRGATIMGLGGEQIKRASRWARRIEGETALRD